MKKKTIPICGMHCRSCELLIEDQLKNLPGVKEVEVSLRRKEAEITYKGQLNLARVEQVVAEAGYSVGEEAPLPWLTEDRKQYDEIALAIGCLVILFILLKSTGILNTNFNFAGSPTSLFVVLLIGLTAGISTCMALVGGLVLGIAARHAEKHPEATAAEKFRPHIFFNLGRIVSYAVLGGLIGMIGKVFQLSGSTIGVLTILVGAVMLLLGIQLTQLSPRLSAFSLSLPAGLGRALGIKKRHEKEYSHRNAMLTGALTFFLPCGFTQAMQLYAMSTGNFWSGALIMGTFAIGTAPGLLGVGGLTSALKGIFAQRFFKFAGLVVIALSLFNISNGMNLTGLSSIILSVTAQSSGGGGGQLARVQQGVQVVNMEQSGSGYSPNNFTVKVGVPVKWVINSTNPNTCAASIYSQQLNVRRNLQAGENIIEFTPKEIGRINFSCSMGMFTGSFNVTDVNTVGTTPVGAAVALAANTQQAPVGGDDGQILKATYTRQGDISPNQFLVKVNQPVRFEIEAKDDGAGCMGSITVPRLTSEVQILTKGQTHIFEFTPTATGSYPITCAMGIPRGTITVN
ncbi:MAG: sulfite exporter TauE/SafE family protein [bacterium]|nr:sulfite exporter TauE/SafE family protein [bacterium]